MSFLKKHYEKLILVVFLLIFIIATVQLILVVIKSQGVNVDDLHFIKKPPDYPKADIANYAPLKLFEKDSIWNQACPRKTEGAPFTDLMNSYPCAPCPSCKKIIPLSDFTNKKCSSCGAALKVIDPNKIDESKDSDGDGVTDKQEIELGMNPNDPSDVYSDPDLDGFSNISEIHDGTNIKDAKSHPPFALRLFVKKIERKLLLLKLEKITRTGDNKNDWTIQINVYISKKKRYDTAFKKIGDTLDLDGMKYKITDIISKKEEKFDPTTKSTSTVDISEIVIQAEKDEPITVKLKEDIYENKETIIVVDSHSGEQFKVIVGQEFSIPDVALKTDEKYSVTRIIDRKTLTVEIQMAGSDKKFEIGAQPTETVKKQEATPQPGDLNSPAFPGSSPPGAEIKF